MFLIVAIYYILYIFIHGSAEKFIALHLGPFERNHISDFWQ